jgi:hypothetical protein
MHSEQIKDAINGITKLCQKNWGVPLWPNGPTGEQYFKALSRRDSDGNPIGSYVEEIRTTEEAFEFLKSQQWNTFSPIAGTGKPGCKYYICSPCNPPRKLIVSAISLGDAIANHLTISIKNGQHGWELVTSGNHYGRTTDIVVAIVEDGMLSTWHPGYPLAPVNNTGEIKFNRFTAVKLIE